MHPLESQQYRATARIAPPRTGCQLRANTWLRGHRSESRFALIALDAGRRGHFCPEMAAVRRERTRYFSGQVRAAYTPPPVVLELMVTHDRARRRSLRRRVASLPLRKPLRDAEGCDGSRCGA